MKNKARKIIRGTIRMKVYLAHLNLTLATLALFFGTVYGFSLFNLINHGVFINSFYSGSGDEKSRIIELEADYVALKRGITMELAEEMGYKEAENPRYIIRKHTGGSLSLGDEI